MELLFENEDTLLVLMKYIENYYYTHSCKSDNISISHSLPNLILLTLCHTCKDFREIILDKRYNFPKIDELILTYKRAVVLPRLKNELKSINERKPILENTLRFLPSKLNILEHKTRDDIYINYNQKTIHHKECCKSFTPSQYYPNDTSNLKRMNRYFKEIKFENKDKITNFTSFEIYIKNHYIFINFKICNNSNICKCLHNEIQKSLKYKLF